MYTVFYWRLPVFTPHVPRPRGCAACTSHTAAPCGAPDVPRLLPCADDGDTDAAVERAMAKAAEAQQLQDDLAHIRARVSDALSNYESTQLRLSLPGGDGPTDATRGGRAYLNRAKQELMDAFNIRLAQQRAQASTLQCTCMTCEPSFVCVGWPRGPRAAPAHARECERECEHAVGHCSQLPSRPCANTTPQTLRTVTSVHRRRPRTCS